MTVRVGILGCGKIAGNHAQALHRIEGADLVACADVDGPRAESFAAENSIPHAFTNLDQLIRSGVDAVCVCTPHPLHEEAVVAAAEAGLHVLCEKPIAVQSAGAQRMTDAAAQAGIIFSVVFQRRFWPAAQRIRRAIDDGRLGEPILGEVTVHLHRDTEYYSADAWRGSWKTDGGGVLMTQAVHQIDLLQWFMGRPVRISGAVATQKHGDHMETEDTASALITFESGATATISATTAAGCNLGNRVSVVGRSGAEASLVECPEGGEAFNDVWTVPGEESFEAPHAAVGDGRPDLSVINAALADFHTLQISDFVNAVSLGKDPLVTGEDATVSLRIIESIYRSARTGQSVQLL